MSGFSLVHQGGSLPILLEVSLQGRALPPSPSSIVSHPPGWCLGLPHLAQDWAAKSIFLSWSPSLFLALHTSPRHLFRVPPYPGTNHFKSFRYSGIGHRSHRGFCAGMECLLAPTLIPQNGLSVPGKKCLEVLGVDGRLPHPWRVDPSFLKSHLLGMYCASTQSRGLACSGGVRRLSAQLCSSAN